MKILFITDNFPPEGNAPASRTYEHAIEWVKAGNEVTVVTGAPNFPEGIIFSGYKNQWYSVESMAGMRVVRVKTYITANEGFLLRVLDYMSFMVSSFVAGLFQKRPDIIIGTSPQFFTVCSAWAIAALRRCPFIFELRDLWPASIKAVSAMQDSLMIRILEHVEMFLYRRSSAIVAVTGKFRSELIDRGIDGNKIFVVTNGVDQARYHPFEQKSEMAEEYGLHDKFVVGYIGTHGMAHALENVLHAAEKLQKEEDIVFLLVGGGAQRNELMQRAETMGLRNVLFIPRQSKELMPAVWGMCDVSLIHLKDDPLFGSVIPSKIFESMGMGLPMILALPEGEATSIIRETQSGLVIPAENPDKLARAVMNVYENPELRKRLSSASAAAASRYSRESHAQKMLQVFKNVFHA